MGSLANIASCTRHIRFILESGHHLDIAECPLLTMARPRPRELPVTNHTFDTGSFYNFSLSNLDGRSGGERVSKLDFSTEILKFT